MKALIIGVGLIGGSFALSLREHGLCDEVLGCDASAANAAEAVRRRLIDRAVEMDEGLAAADLVVLAAPVDKIPLLTTKILNKKIPADCSAGIFFFIALVITWR